MNLQHQEMECVWPEESAGALGCQSMLSGWWVKVCRSSQNSLSRCTRGQMLGNDVGWLWMRLIHIDKWFPCRCTTQCNSLLNAEMWATNDYLAFRLGKFLKAYQVRPKILLQSISTSLVLVINTPCSHLKEIAVLECTHLLKYQTYLDKWIFVHEELLVLSESDITV